MGCHLNELIEQAESGALTALPELMSTAKRDLPRFLGRAICFDMGPEEQQLEWTSIRGMFVLPFETCWFEGSLPADEFGAGAGIGVLATKESDGVVIWVFRRELRKWALLCAGAGIHESTTPEGRHGLLGHYLPAQKSNDDIGNWAAHNLWCFLSALHCVNVGTVENLPPAPCQRARAKRGKRPLFSYWTLTIELNRRRAPRRMGDGSHASPRLHLRRGHPREFEPGRWTWVQPHVVGNKSAGMIHKEYKVVESEAA